MARLAAHLAGGGLACAAAAAQAVRLVAVAVELCRWLLLVALGALLHQASDSAQDSEFHNPTTSTRPQGCSSNNHTYTR